MTFSLLWYKRPGILANFAAEPEKDYSQGILANSDPEVLVETPEADNIPGPGRTLSDPSGDLRQDRPSPGRNGRSSKALDGILTKHAIWLGIDPEKTKSNVYYFLRVLGAAENSGKTTGANIPQKGKE